MSFDFVGPVIMLGLRTALSRHGHQREKTVPCEVLEVNQILRTCGKNVPVDEVLLRDE